MQAWRLAFKDLLVIRLDRGEDLLRGIEQALTHERISDGAIISACGSVLKYSIHMVDTSSFPPIDYFESKSGPYQIQALQGIVADGELHAHVILSNKYGAFGGHLEEGCEIFTGAEIAMIVIEPHILRRVPDSDFPESGIRCLASNAGTKAKNSDPSTVR